MPANRNRNAKFESPSTELIRQPVRNNPAFATQNKLRKINGVETDVAKDAQNERANVVLLHTHQ